jgi:sialate O-acetylesterase
MQTGKRFEGDIAVMELSRTTVKLVYSFFAPPNARNSIAHVTILPAIFSKGMVLQRDACVPIWGRADPGTGVTVSIQGQTHTASANGEGRWSVILKQLQAGGPHTMAVRSDNFERVITDVLVGEVWLCSGQCNMAMTIARGDRYWCGVEDEAVHIAKADYPEIRSFKVPVDMGDAPGLDTHGSWYVCSPRSVGTFSAIGYFFAKELREVLNVPIGIITSAYGASTAEAWLSVQALGANERLRFLAEQYEERRKAFDPRGADAVRYRAAYRAWQLKAAYAKKSGLDQPKGPKSPDPCQDQHNPATLYNKMIAPLAPYAIRGVLWYQGESNCPTAHLYRDLLGALIENWRAIWGIPELPFLIVQLPNFKRLAEVPQGRSAWATIREAQLRGLSIRGTGLAVTIDLGDPENIHPKRKQEVGSRLSLAARALVYHQRITFSGPMVQAVLREGKKMRIKFVHLDRGLISCGPILTGFAIAGENMKYAWADASIEGDCVIVSHSSIEFPVAVRYAWADNPPATLYNFAGLPASPFRTDDW